MKIDLPLTIERLRELGDYQLQRDYLNDPAQTAAMIELVAQLTERDLAANIIDLAWDVDFCLGAKLAGAIDAKFELQIGAKIDRLDATMALKVYLWGESRARSSLNYLTDVFADRYRYFDLDYQDTIAAIIKIDRALAISLLIAEIDRREDNYPQAADILADLAPVEAIEVLGDLLQDRELVHDYAHSFALKGLAKIGRHDAIDKIRDALYAQQGNWYRSLWIAGLGIVAEPEMVEYLIYLLYQPTHYLSPDPDTGVWDDFQIGEMCCQAISALARIGGDNIFEILYRALYWLPEINYPDPIERAIDALYRIDRQRTIDCLERTIQSTVPQFKKRALIALKLGAIERERQLSILQTAIEDPDLDVRLMAISSLRKLSTDLHLSSPPLLELIAAANPRQQARAIELLSPEDPAEREWIIRSLDRLDLPVFDLFHERIDGNIEPADLPILQTYLNNDRIEIRAFAIANLGRIADETFLPELVKLLSHPQSEIRLAAVRAIVRMESSNTTPIAIEIAADPELVTTLILEIDRALPTSNLYSNLHQNLTLTRTLIDRAETTSIDLLTSEPDNIIPIVQCLGSIGGERSIFALERIIEDEYYSYTGADEAIAAVANIGGDLARSILLGFLPDDTQIGGWIYNQFHHLGTPESIPHLWAAQSRSHYLYLDAIFTIQHRYGIYNPQLSIEI